MKKTILLILLFVLNNILVWGQEKGRINREPISFSIERLKPIEQIIEMPEFDKDSIRRVDSIIESMGMAPYYHHHRVDFTPQNSGQWDTLEDGSRLWRIAFFCHNAPMIALTFGSFWIPKGANVSFYSYDKQKTTFMMTSDLNRGRTKYNPKKNTTDDIFDRDTVVLEYFIPNGCIDDGNISIESVKQGYIKYLKKQSESYKYNGNMRYYDSFFGESADCNININCSLGQDWQLEKNAIVKIITDVGRFTGFLVNTTSNDYRPYIITANHCLYNSQWSQLYDANGNTDLDDWRFYFNLETYGCNDSIIQYSPFVLQGAELLANNNISDFALLRLDNNPKDYNMIYPPHYLGWNAENTSDKLDMICIHHPKGDVKKIATMEDNSYSSVGSNNFWQVYWKQTTNGHDVTANFSSGAPLINGEKHIIGQLKGGKYSKNECEKASVNYSWFGKFSVSGDTNSDTTKQLKHWLDPNDTGATICKGTKYMYKIIINI